MPLSLSDLWFCIWLGSIGYYPLSIDSLRKKLDIALFKKNVSDNWVTLLWLFLKK